MSDPTRNPSDQSINSGSSVVVGAQRMLGETRPSNATHGEVQRDELITAGHSQQDVNNIEVQRHQQEVIERHFVRWLLCFSSMICILCPTLFGVLLWMVMNWSNARSHDIRCDAPLIDWVTVVYLLKCYQWFVHRLVLRCVCKYNPNVEPPQPIPKSVTYLNILLAIFDFVWNMFGIIIATSSKTCADLLPDLYHSVLAFTILSSCSTVFIVVNSIGIQTILAYMLRNGMLKDGSLAAPHATLDMLTVVQYKEDDQIFAEQVSCSICLDDFNDQKEIRKTCCSHCFHTACLKGWLNVNRTCPLCREDLTGTGTTVGQAATEDGFEGAMPV